MPAMRKADATLSNTTNKTKAKNLIFVILVETSMVATIITRERNEEFTNLPTVQFKLIIKSVLLIMKK